MKKRSLGQYLVLAGNLLMCTGLLLNGFGIISKTFFRAMGFTGGIIFVTALIIIFKKSEF